MKSHVLCILGILATLLTSVSKAELIQIDFSGVITEVAEGFVSEVVGIGTSINGSLRYDDELPPIPSTLHPPIYSFGGTVELSALLTNGGDITQLDWSYAKIRINKDDGLFEPTGDFLSITVKRELMITGRDPIESVTLNFETLPESTLQEQDLKTSTPLLLNCSLSSYSIRIQVKGHPYFSYALGTFDYKANSVWAGFNILEDGKSVNTGNWLGWVDVTFKPFIYIYSLKKYVYLPEKNINISGGWVWIAN